MTDEMGLLQRIAEAAAVFGAALLFSTALGDASIAKGAGSPILLTPAWALIRVVFSAVMALGFRPVMEITGDIEG